MRNIKIVFSYDGGLFFGSQAQSNKKTVQDELELAIFKLTREKVRITVAGRTDRGVHAFSQAANFVTSSSIPADRFPQALNSKLGKGIIVNGAREAPLTFHSRKQARSREYLYFVFNGKCLPVIFWDKVLQVTKPLDLKKMSEAARLFVGEHYFVNFCGKGSSQNNYFRRVREFEVGLAGSDLVKKIGFKGDLICFKIVADSFLYKMVRFIVATLLDVGAGRIDIGTVKRLIKGDPVDIKCPIVASCGLYLNNVKY
ncbi:MAG: tRNA pseudouridine(38-40) synthase TruA [bacterium]